MYTFLLNARDGSKFEKHQKISIEFILTQVDNYSTRLDQLNLSKALMSFFWNVLIILVRSLIILVIHSLTESRLILLKHPLENLRYRSIIPINVALRCAKAVFFSIFHEAF